MKANELMIGDWVIDGKNIAQITSIVCDGIIGTTFNESSNIEVIEPIPLTPEILEKNGFEEDDGAYIYYTAHYDDYINWCGTILKIGCDNGNMELVDVQYIHQLQHVLRLCGIEKEIIL